MLDEQTKDMKGNVWELRFLGEGTVIADGCHWNATAYVWHGSLVFPGWW